MDNDLKQLKHISFLLRCIECNFGLPETQNQTLIELNKLDKAISSLKIVQREKLCKHPEYSQILSSIRFGIQSIIKTTKDKTWKSSLIKVRDQIFGSKLKGLFDQDKDNSNRKATLVFVEFIKGITYFSHEKPYNTKDMIYHRNGSCSKTGTTNINCDNQSSKSNHTTRKSNTHLIEKCYIERLIYDQLWLHIQQVPQDIAHVEWLQTTKEAYKSCVPSGSIQVKIGQYKNMPEKLTIERYIDQVLVDTEMYKKHWNKQDKCYDDLVKCIKHKPIAKSTYAKDQTYMNPSTWTNMNPKKRPDNANMDYNFSNVG